VAWWTNHYDDYDTWLSAGSASDMARLHGLEQVGFAAKVMSHPAYDAFWQDQALDKILAKQGVAVPVMLVTACGPRGYLRQHRALQSAQGAGLGQSRSISRHRTLVSPSGKTRWRRRRTDSFRQRHRTVFSIARAAAVPGSLSQGRSGSPEITRGHRLETGTNRWQELPTWPSGCASGCGIDHENLYLQAGGNLHFGTAAGAAADFDAYVSDPAKPVPYLPRPIHIGGEEGETNWQTWLVGDQRDAASRTDVLSFATPVLTDPVKISGQPLANLVASTSGTDGDFVVKLIDVYPDEVGREPKWAGIS